MRYFLLSWFSLIIFVACYSSESKEERTSVEENSIVNKFTKETDTITIDSNYTFSQAIAGSNAPQSVIDELELIEVNYISTDNKLHQGQVLTNKRIAPDIKEIFGLMLEQKFVIERAVPIVAYNWSDSLSMANNNSYSFCYQPAL